MFKSSPPRPSRSTKPYSTWLNLEIQMTSRSSLTVSMLCRRSTEATRRGSHTWWTSSRTKHSISSTEMEFAPPWRGYLVTLEYQGTKKRIDKPYMQRNTPTVQSRSPRRHWMQTRRSRTTSITYGKNNGTTRRRHWNTEVSNHWLPEKSNWQTQIDTEKSSRQEYDSENAASTKICTGLEGTLTEVVTRAAQQKQQNIIFWNAGTMQCSRRNSEKFVKERTSKWISIQSYLTVTHWTKSRTILAEVNVNCDINIFTSFICSFNWLVLYNVYEPHQGPTDRYEKAGF